MLVETIERRGVPGNINHKWYRAWLALDLLIHHCRECPEFRKETVEFREKEEK